MFTVTWNETQYVDLLPDEFFRFDRAPSNVRHDVRGPRLGLSKAKCDLHVHGKYAKLNYRPHMEFNSKWDWDDGMMRLEFSDETRTSLKRATWSADGGQTFRTFDATLGYEAESSGLVPTLKAKQDPDLLDDGYPEGRAILVTHLRRERSRALVADKKSQALNSPTKLRCEACDFDFSVQYKSKDAQEFCEVHHRFPLASGGRATPRLADLAILCSNCHRIIHRIWPIPTVEEFASKYVNRCT